MILSNVEIQRAIDAGRLVLDPEPLPRRPAPDGADCPYQTSAVDLQLGDDADTDWPDIPIVSEHPRSDTPTARAAADAGGHTGRLAFAAAVRQARFSMMAAVYFVAQDVLRWRVPPQIRHKEKPRLRAGVDLQVLHGGS